MVTKRTVALLVVAHLIAAVGAFAQEETSAEFGRASSGEIEVMTKQPRGFSGSLGFSMSTGGSFGSFGPSRGYEATIGGTLLEDRLWFFAAGQQNESRLVSGTSQLQLPERAVTGAVDAKVMAQLGDRQSFSAFFDASRQPYAPMPGTFTAVVPSSFLSMRYTGIVSSSMLLNVSFTRSSATQPAWPFTPIQ